MKRVKAINDKYIGNAIAYCHCESHLGALNKDLMYRHKCIGKRCKWLEMWQNESHARQKYYNRYSKK